MSGDHEISKKSKSRKLSKEAWIETLVNVGIQVNNKKPSKELISLIVSLSLLLLKFSNKFNKCVEAIKKKGYEERFSDFELSLLAREILHDRMSSRQLSYWFPLRTHDKKNRKKEQSSISNLRLANNDNSKDTEKYYRSELKDKASISPRPVNAANGIRREEKDNQVGSEFHPAGVETSLPPLVNKLKSTISYFDLPSPETIDCTNHPMYRRAEEKMARQEQISLKKDVLIKQLKEELRKINGTSLDSTIKEGSSVSAKGAAGDIPQEYEYEYE